jgi:hypothetical protein
MTPTCGACDQPMLGHACTWQTATIEGIPYMRFPYGPVPGSRESATLYTGWPEAFPATCHDCGTPQGSIHHPVCDAEFCPRCLWQAISCGCRWEGDTPVPGFDPAKLNAESPNAVRAS